MINNVSGEVTLPWEKKITDIKKGNGFKKSFLVWKDANNSNLMNLMSEEHEIIMFSIS